MNDINIPIAQVGSTRAFLTSPMVIPRGSGELIIEIDDATDRWLVEIEGCPTPSLDVAIRLLPR
jgi:hypothetical protein